MHMLVNESPSHSFLQAGGDHTEERRRSRARARAAFLFLGVWRDRTAEERRRTCTAFVVLSSPKPEYTLLQRLRNDVLGGCTQRVAIATALRVTAEVVREGGVRRVVEHYNEFRSAAPSERRDDLLPMKTILQPRPAAHLSRRRRLSPRRRPKW